MNKNFKLFIINSACSLLAIEIFYLAIPLTTITLGYSAIETGWCTFAFFLPVILVKIFAAPVIENNDKKTTLLVSEIGRISCVIFFIGSLFFFDFKSIYYIILISFIFGFFTILTEIAEPCALKSLIANKNATSILTKYEMRTRGVQLVAPSICGLLITYSIFFPYLILCLISFAAILSLFRIKLNEQSISSKKCNSFFGSINDALSWLKNNKLFTIIVLLTSINNFLHQILYLTIIFSLKSMNVGFDITGYILSGLGVGGIIGSLVAGNLARHINFRSLLLSVNILRITGLSQQIKVFK